MRTHIETESQLDEFLQAHCAKHGAPLDNPEYDLGGYFALTFSGYFSEGELSEALPIDEAASLADSAIMSAAMAELDFKCADYSFGKPSQIDVERIARDVAQGLGLHVSFDCEGNAVFSRVEKGATRRSGHIENTIDAGARITLAILKEWISPDDLKACAQGANPHDYCDANIALYGAFAAIHFAEPDAASDEDSTWLNAVSSRLDDLIRQE